MDFADEGEFEDEIICEAGSGTAEDNEFDLIVSALEEVILDEEFNIQQTEYCDRHCDIFEDNDENKLEYTDIFQEYTSFIERIIESNLTEKIPDFSMQKFEKLLSTRSDQLSGDVFDLLISLGDFNEFKQLMLSQKRTKNSGSELLGLSVQGTAFGGLGPDSPEVSRRVVHVFMRRRLLRCLYEWNLEVSLLS
eukprot:gene2739-5394_t